MQLLYTDLQLHCNPYKNGDKIFSLYLETLIYNFMCEMFGILAQFIDAQIIYEKARCRNKNNSKQFPKTCYYFWLEGVSVKAQSELEPRPLYLKSM